jgi:hypothetical protein
LVTVRLANSSGKIYNMRILSLNDTYIKTGIPGGLPGVFKVYVNVQGLGDAIPEPTSANIFTYELVITSVSPSNGSYNGGTLLSIKGINISPDILENLMFIGDEINVMCKIESVNQTNIACRTPPIHANYQVNTPLDVVLTNRLIIDNTCSAPSICKFSYIDTSSSPNIVSISTNSITTGDITVNGTNLNIGGSCVVVLTNKITSQVKIVNATLCNATTAIFTLPST